MLVQAAAGAAAGGLARCVVAPLDVVKIRLQVQLEPTRGGLGKYTGLRQALALIVREEGVRGLWRGTVPALLLWVPYTAVQFASLERLNKARERCAPRTPHARTPLLTLPLCCALLQLCDAAGLPHDKPPASFACGAAAAAVATSVTYPLDLLRTIMAAQGVPAQYPTLASALRGTLASRGTAGLTAGLGLTVRAQRCFGVCKRALTVRGPAPLCLKTQLMEIIPYAALQFGSYAALKSALAARNLEASGGREADGESLSSLQKFCAGVLAGSAAKMALHPMDVAKKRMQVAGLLRPASYGASVAPGAYRGALHCLSSIAKKEGLAGLYKGILPNVLKAAPASGITFVVYEGLVGLYQTRASQRAQEARRREGN